MRKETTPSVIPMLWPVSRPRHLMYALLFEIKSVEARDRYAPTSGEPSEEAKRIGEAFVDMWEKWRRLATIPGEDTTYTDYIVVSD
jgi:hypothetical protein